MGEPGAVHIADLQAQTRHTGPMSTRYGLADAQALLPEARRRIGDVAAMVADLRHLMGLVESGRAPAAAVDDIDALERGIEAAMAWFEDQAIQVKGLSPALLDFPARAIRDGEVIEVLLCWRDDEDTIAYYHPPETGYRGREPVAMLDDV